MSSDLNPTPLSLGYPQPGHPVLRLSPEEGPRAGRGMGRNLRAILASILISLLSVGCAHTEQSGPTEGQVFFRAGAAASGTSAASVGGGPSLRRLGILTPAFDPAWQAAWIEGDAKTMSGAGALTGFVTGISILSAMPVVFVMWPVAVGVVAGTTAMGAFGQHIDNSPLSHVSLEDRATLLAAAARLRLDRLLRDAVTNRLTDLTARPPVPVLWYPTLGPDTAGTDPLADARDRGVDGLLELGVEAFGLAAGEDEATFGFFIRIRARVVEPAGGRLRYERVLEYGPGQRLPGVPPADVYSVEFLAVDQAQVFRQQVRETVERIARALAEDPAFPLAPR